MQRDAHKRPRSASLPRPLATARSRGRGAEAGEVHAEPRFTTQQRGKRAKPWWASGSCRHASY
jgi:hypothetical protein